MFTRRLAVALALAMGAALAISAPAHAAERTEITVMTYNVCSTQWGCDKTWKKRQPKAAALVASQAPDIVATQEDFHDIRKGLRVGEAPAMSRYTLAYAAGGRGLYLKDSSFELVTDHSCRTVDHDVFPGSKRYVPLLDDMEEVTDGSHESHDVTWGGSVYRLRPFDPDRVDTNGAVGYVRQAEKCWDTKHAGVLTIGKFKGAFRAAVWAEVGHKATRRSFMAVSFHVAAGTGASYDRERRKEIRSLLRQMKKVKNSGLPTIYMGDANSYAGLRLDGPGKAFEDAGYVDAYRTAATRVLASHNSFNDFKRTPRRQHRHIDRVFVRPGVRVDRWKLVATFSGKRYAPLPSDHHPVLVSLSFA